MITETTYYPELWADSLHRFITLEELGKYVRELESAGCDPCLTLIYPNEGLVARKVTP